MPRILPALASDRHDARSIFFQAEATPSSDTPWDWQPPPIPEPLPEPGGPVVEPVGKGPQRTASPPLELPSVTGATPEAAGVVVDPAGPPQPMATPDAAPEAEPEPAATVTMTPEFAFDPPDVSIQAGESVRWVNAGRAPQTVTTDPARAKDPSIVVLPDAAEPFSSGVVNGGGSFTMTFDVPGDYAYFSMPQEQAGMVGRIRVEG